MINKKLIIKKPPTLQPKKTLPPPAPAARGDDDDDDDDDDTSTPISSPSLAAPPPLSKTTSSSSSKMKTTPADPFINSNTPSPMKAKPLVYKSTLGIDLVKAFGALRAAEIKGVGIEEQEEWITLHRVNAIQAFESILVSLGLDPKHIFCSGKLLEIMSAAQIGATTSTHMNGPDAVTKDGAPVEFKNSMSPLGVKANFSIVLPKRKTNETADDYYKRMEMDFLSKGKVVMKHRYASGQCNDYELSPEFLAFYCRSKNVIGSQKVNVGAVSCVVCKKVHRLCKLMEYQKIWEEEQKLKVAPANRQNWKALFMVPVTQTCDRQKAAPGEDFTFVGKPDEEDSSDDEPEVDEKERSFGFDKNKN